VPLTIVGIEGEAIIIQVKAAALYATYFYIIVTDIGGYTKANLSE